MHHTVDRRVYLTGILADEDLAVVATRPSGRDAEQTAPARPVTWIRKCRRAHVGKAGRVADDGELWWGGAARTR